jgi:hypothetical protein
VPRASGRAHYPLLGSRLRLHRPGGRETASIVATLEDRLRLIRSPTPSLLAYFADTLTPLAALFVRLILI